MRLREGAAEWAALGVRESGTQMIISVVWTFPWQGILLAYTSTFRSSFFAIMSYMAGTTNKVIRVA